MVTQGMIHALVVGARARSVRSCLVVWAVLFAGATAQAAPANISAGRPVTITTNGAWEAGGYSPSNVTDGSLSCVDLASSSEVGTVGWQNNDYNELGVVNVTIDLGDAYTIDSIDYNMDCAIVLGAEGKGVHDLVAKKCDFLVSIPMLGKVPSLNVSVAAGVVLYEVVRQRRKQNP